MTAGESLAEYGVPYERTDDANGAVGTLLPGMECKIVSTETGEELWRGRLPATGQASPATYRLGPDRRQFVVIAAGGHAGLGTPLSDALVAFALP